MVVVPISPYIKKEDALKAFKKRKVSTIALGAFYFIMSWFLFFIFPPRVLMANEGPVTLPYVLLRCSLLFISPFIYLTFYAPVIFSKDYEKKYLDRLKKYKNGEMINTSELYGQSRQGIGSLLYILALGAGVMIYLVKFF